MYIEKPLKIIIGASAVIVCAIVIMSSDEMVRNTCKLTSDSRYMHCGIVFVKKARAKFAPDSTASLDTVFECWSRRKKVLGIVWPIRIGQINCRSMS